MTSDPIDDSFGRLGPPLDRTAEALEREGGPNESRSRWKGLLDWSSTSAPVALLLLTGLAFGPQGVNLLSPALLSALDPVVPIAVAALGVLAGLSVGDRRPDDRRIFAAAVLGAMTSMFVVSTGFAAVLRSAPWPPAAHSWLLIVGAGICAATSLTLSAANSLEPRSVSARLVGVGVFVPIVAGGCLMARLQVGSSAEAAILVAQASAVTLALAAAAWLLLTRVSSDTEERVIAISALLLVGGAGEALSLSALFSGLVAGLFWRYAGARPRDSIGRDVLFVQHPLLVLVLLLAGARAEFSLTAVGLGMAYLALRVIGQLAGGIAAGRAAGIIPPRDVVPTFIAPGVLGVAFALNASGATDPAASSVLLATVVVGTIGSEFLIRVVPSAPSAAE
jgi:hypothetical protein